MRVILQEFKKELKIQLSYPIEIGFWVFGPLLWVVPLIFQGQALVGGLQSTTFGNLSGTSEFIPYVLIGAIFSTYMFSAIWSMGNSFRNEQFYGTLEGILSSPVRPIYILMGKGLYNSALSSACVVIQIFICMFLFGLTITLQKIVPMVFFLVLLLIGLYGVGFIAAALTLLVKEAHGLLHLFEYVLFLFSPIRYPVEIHPVTRAISVFIPLTYALLALRGILLGLEYSFWRSSLFLFGLDCAIIPLGILVFVSVERRTKTKGTLAHY